MDQIHLRTDLPQTVINHRQRYRVDTHISGFIVYAAEHR